MTQQHSETCGGGGISRQRADRIVSEEVVRRVRFTIAPNAEFMSSSNGWTHASLTDQRRVLSAVLDRVVIVPREPGEATSTPRRLRIEWKPEFVDAELVAAPLEERVARERAHVREGRAESHRAGRQERDRAQRSRRSKAYFEEWRVFRDARQS